MKSLAKLFKRDLSPFKDVTCNTFTADGPLMLWVNLPGIDPGLTETDFEKETIERCSSGNVLDFKVSFNSPFTDLLVVLKNLTNFCWKLDLYLNLLLIQITHKVARLVWE